MKYVVLLFALFPMMLAASFPEEETLPEDQVLIDEISPNYYFRGKGTPAEYVTSQLGYFHPVVRAMHFLSRKRLIRDSFTFGTTPEAARKVIETFQNDAKRGWEWSEKRREVVIPRSPDGKPDWKNALTFRGEIPLDTAGREPEGGTVWQVTADGNFLYFKIKVEDADVHIDPVRPFDADSIEIFIKGDTELLFYWELVASAGGPDFAGTHQFSPVLGIRAYYADARPDRMFLKGEKTQNGFSVECRFPFFALPRLDRALPFEGAKIEFMFVRTDGLGGKVTKSAPVPLLYDGHNLFGYIIGTLE